MNGDKAAQREWYRRCVKSEVFGGKKPGIARFFRAYLEPSLHAVWLVRKYQYHSRVGHKQRAIFAKCRLARLYGIFVGANTEIDIGLRFPHPTSIIIGQAAKLGKNCTIFQNVTIGSRNTGDWKLGLQPEIGDKCTLFAGCKVIGAIKLGEGTKIGANTVMNKDSSKDSVWVGIPAREITKKEEKTEK